MTTTGPLPVIRDISTNDARLAALDKMGAPRHGGFQLRMATAEVVIDNERRIMFIACEPDPDPGDWAMVCRLIVSVGYDNGHWPHRSDPGEPEFDPLSRVDTWRLEYV